QLLRRARVATDNDGSDLTTLHPDNPTQPLAPIVFLAAAPDGPIATALAAILAVGSRLAIAGLLLGPWPTGATWHVNTDGTTRPPLPATPKRARPTGPAPRHRRHHHHHRGTDPAQPRRADPGPPRRRTRRRHQRRTDGRAVARNPPALLPRPLPHQHLRAARRPRRSRRRRAPP